MRRIVLAALAAALTFIALAAPSAAGGCINTTRPVEGTSPDVRIDKCQFRSGALRVPVGTAVTWTNDDVFPHEISGSGWGSRSTLSSGGVFAWTFTEAGIYPYTCALHPGMSAVVLVGDAATSAPTTSGDPWLASAVLASILVGVTGFAAGRYLGR